MAVLAACGLIYEYLLSHYAGRVLGVMENAIFAMIGVMIVSMGVGAFSAKLIKCPFSGFAWLEVFIALLGASGVLLIAVVFAVVDIFPRVLSENYGLPIYLIPTGGLTETMNEIAEIFPYVIGFFIGAMVGMEIPFIARVRENIYGQHIEHNAGTIYGADYIGAGIGSAIFVIFILAMPVEKAAVLTAIVNLFAGLAFLFVYFSKIKFAKLLLTGHLLVSGVMIVLLSYGVEWGKNLEDMLYEDKVVFSTDTKFQHVTVTKRLIGSDKPPIYALYLNGRTQFSSDDEYMYHSMLVYPPMAASARQDNVLIIGGGDGLALRDALKWNPKTVTVLELDEVMVEFFSKPKKTDVEIVNKPLLELNKNSFSDKRVKVIYNDAFNSVDDLLANGKKFDVIITDLPDPSHPDLNKLYSVKFYKKLHDLLAGDGAISVQSTSPYHAKEAFLTVGKTMETAGFKHVERYHHNVPSFGEWGWTIATKNGSSAKTRIKRLDKLNIKDDWINKEKILSAFTFGANFFNNIKTLEPNRIGTNLMYRLHQKAWN
ncbi:MAG: polyamine aminopropyltransferase [Alphaproteobacteria bacterium]|nr:polyamine aminopropyltransferase [Alphaproteobacteria bacterium]